MFVLAIVGSKDSSLGKTTHDGIPTPKTILYPAGAVRIDSVHCCEMARFGIVSSNRLNYHGKKP